MEEEPLQLKGYGQAVIHLAWYRNNQTRHLLFGMVELRPTEFSNVSSCTLKSARIGNKGGTYLHYRRFSFTADAAISWYEAALAGNTVLPNDADHPTQGDGAVALSVEVAEIGRRQKICGNAEAKEVEPKFARNECLHGVEF